MGLETSHIRLETFKMFPICQVCVEDIKARTIKGVRKWNQSFSPLEVGKHWFYNEIRKRWSLLTLQGWETKSIRDRLGLKKASQKLSETFEAHCVDSWCLAYHTVGGADIVDNKEMLFLSHLYRLSDANFIVRTRKKVATAPDMAGQCGRD